MPLDFDDFVDLPPHVGWQAIEVAGEGNGDDVSHWHESNCRDGAHARLSCGGHPERHHPESRRHQRS
jgi:hypothetical protein